MALGRKAKRALGTKYIAGLTAVAGLTSIDGLSVTRDTQDVSTLDNVDGYREYIATWKDTDEVSIEGFALDDVHLEQLIALFEDDEEFDNEIRFPASIGKSWKFKGICTAFSTSVDLDDPLSFSLSIKPTGKPELIDTVGA